MTTPGTVSGQAATASQAGVGAVRDAGATSAPGGQTAEGEDGFGDVLSKLQKSDSDEPTLPKDHPRVGERTNTRRHALETQLITEGSSADSSISSVPDVSDNDLQFPGGPQPEGAVVAQSDPLGLVAAVPNGMLVASPGKNEPSAPVSSSSPPQTADPSAETRSATVPQTETALQLQVEAMAKAESGNIDPLATAGDPALARLASHGPANDRDNLERAQRSRTPVTSMETSTPQPNGDLAPVQRHEVRPKANVLRQETHFAPPSFSTVSPQASVSVGHGDKSATAPEASGGESAAAPSSVAAVPSFEDSSSVTTPPAQQIADRIVAEATSAPEFAERAGMTPPMQQGMKPALKILQIQLQPADLGTLTVRMELKDTELTLHVEADRKETADLIRNDRDTLANLLRSAGYNVDTGSVRIMDDRTLASQQSGQQGAQTNLQSSAQSQSGASDRQGHAQRDGAGTNGGDTGHQTGRNDTNETTTNRPDRGVYV